METDSTVFMCRDGAGARYMAQQLGKEGLLSAIIVEKGNVARNKKIRRTLKKTSWWQIPLLPLDMGMLALYGFLTRRALQRLARIPSEYPKGISVYFVDDINSDDCVSIITTLSPRIGLVYGTSIIGDEVLSLPWKYLLNVHGGLVPEYRNVHAEFWAVNNGHPEDVGTSILYLTKGVDDGMVAFRESVEIAKGEQISLTVLRAKNIVLGGVLAARAKTHFLVYLNKELRRATLRRGLLTFSLFRSIVYNTMSRPIYIVVGTRAQLIKTAPIMKELDTRGISYEYIFTGQHIETIEDLESGFSLKTPDINVTKNIEADSPLRFLRWMVLMGMCVFRPSRVLKKGKGIVVNHGDTISALWGTILGRLHGSETMHLESGLRSFNIFHPFPEELTRLMIFWFTDIYCCPNDTAVRNLSKYRGVILSTKGNTLIDAVRIARKNGHNPFTHQKPYAIFSMHRFENIFRTGRFRENIEILFDASVVAPITFVLHPVTRRMLDRTGLRKKIEEHPRIRLSERFNFIEFINILSESEFLVTDGGSNQEESSYLGVPTLLLRSATERTEGMGHNVLLSKYDRNVIRDFFANYSQYRRAETESSHSPSTIIVDYLESHI